MGLDGAEYLERNDSAGFFSKVGGQIMTGPTGTNVCDVWVGWRMDE
jgi:glycerate-2-kinase